MLSESYLEKFSDPHRATYACEKYLGKLADCLSATIAQFPDPGLEEAWDWLSEARGEQWALIARRSLGIETGTFDDAGAARNFNAGLRALEKARLAKSFEERLKMAGLSMSPWLEDTYVNSWEGEGTGIALPPRSRAEKERVDLFADLYRRAGNAVNNQTAEVLRRDVSSKARLAVNYHIADSKPFCDGGKPLWHSEEELAEQIEEFGRLRKTDLRRMPGIALQPERKRQAPAMSF